MDYRFNTWRVSGEKAEEWSLLAYRLMRVNILAERNTGIRLGAVLYQHYVKGMSPSQIRKSPIGIGLPVTSITAIIRGYNVRGDFNSTAEVYNLFQHMLETEPEMLDMLFKIY